MHGYTSKFFAFVSLTVLVSLLVPATGLAVTPTVKTVPWVPTNPLIPHDTWSGRSITLKGTTDVQGSNFQWTWDFGDGSPAVTGAVTDRHVLEATHTYTGATFGLVFTARLTVADTNTGDSASKTYFVALREKSLETETNVAIDEGLWYLHKTENRSTVGITDFGEWTSGGGFAASAYYGVTASNVSAFEVNGHVESGDSSNPYVETVQRAMRSLFSWLLTGAVSAVTNGIGTFTPDGNGNGYAAYVNQGFPFYQGGMFIDAIVASGTPNALATTGPGPSGSNPGIVGRAYRDIVQDLVDGYEYCQYTGGAGGGWRYNCGEYPDNSACQWAAIGLIPAERVFRLTIPKIVKDWNRVWLATSQDSATGVFGYVDTNPIWGPYAVTPSGMVQMVMDGIGRGNPMWDKAETFMRDNFGNVAGEPTVSVKSYYYGMFSLVKSLLLHDPVGNGVAQPITLLQSATQGVPPIDWYKAQTSKGDPTDGVARTLVNDQNPAGYWSGHNFASQQFPFETAWAIAMANRTIFTARPVAVAKATPNPALANQTITFDGSASFHQDPAKTIVSWEWDFDNNGTFDASGPTATASFPTLGEHPSKLRVTDNSGAFDEVSIKVVITIPPVAPTANAGGPYVFCPQSKPWFLDGTHSVNPDEGMSEPGKPGDTIKEYAWDLGGTGKFTDAFGPTPDVTSIFTNLGPGGYLVQLRVTDTTATSFPSSGQPDLTSTAPAQVVVKASCACIANLLATATVDRKIQLTWGITGADHYNVYRSTFAGGPYIFLAPTQSPNYLDGTVVPGTTYYYVVKEATSSGDETCQSNEASASPLPPSNGPPVPNPGSNQTVECQGSSGTPVTLDGSASSDPDRDPLTFVWRTTAGTVVGTTPVVNLTLPLGPHTFILTVSDGRGGTAEKSVEVSVRDTTPPTTRAGVKRTMLWPPSHDLIDVGFSFAAEDGCEPQPAITLSVTANEPPDADTGDGNFSPDGSFLRDASGRIVGLRLRAERKGDGKGRVYLIKLAATDKSGSSATRCLAVTVPRDQSAASIAAINSQAAAAVAACIPLVNNVLGPPDGPAPVIGPKQ